MITNIVNNKIYIGKHKVKNPHDYYFANGISTNGKIYGSKNTYFSKAILKYGFENFKKDILLYCDEKDLNNMEIYYIGKYKSNDHNIGYNLTIGRDGTNGYKMTPEHKAKIGIANKNCSQETREKLRIANTGKKHSNETKEKLRLLRIGKTLSEETKKRVSESGNGRVLSEETKRKIGDANRIALSGKKLSESHKNNIRLGSFKRYSKENNLQNQILTNKRSE